MSLLTAKMSRPSESMETPELDVTPVMNLLIILIPFLVSMAVFTHLAVLRFSLPSNVGSGSAQQNVPPKLKLTVVIAENYCAITHGEKMLDSLATGSGTMNSTLLTERLQDRRASAGIDDEVIIAVRNSIPFEKIVKVMDSCREAGFEKIGLSNATEDPSKGA